MRLRVLAALVLVFALAGSLAAEKISTTINCGAPANPPTVVEVGDMPGHTVSLTKNECPYTAGSVGGVKVNEGEGAEFADIKGDRTTFHGYWQEEYENGDKIFYKYEGTGMLKDGKLVSATDKWSVLSGTGKMKGASGKGTCTGKAEGDNFVWNCNGDIKTGM